MKKVINGVLYNTETAKRIGSWDNGHYTTDFAYCSEDLYRSRSGRYFLHGDGGANSRYGKRIGNDLIGGEDIIPMALAEAVKWAEEHLDGDAYAAAFGEPEDGKVYKGFKLSYAAVRRLEEMQAERGGTLSAIVEALITGE